MIEEYTKGCGPSYYKCLLCGAHGKIDPMYHHVIGKKHTEKYIVSIDYTHVCSSLKEL